MLRIIPELLERQSAESASRNHGLFRVQAVLAALVFLAVAGCGNAKQDTTPTTDTTSTSSTQTSAAVSPGRANDSSAAADVVRRYYDAISSGQYDIAYALWENSGKASGKTRTEFATGFAQTKSATVTVGSDAHVEGAAGSQYATVPVTVNAVQRDGTVQHFTGTYTLRRSMVDGATAAQRAWHISSASLKPY